MGFGNGLNLRYYKKGETLSKSYIINKMMGDLRYGSYVPDSINPSDLSRNFLLTVSLYNLYNIIISNKAYSLCQS